MQARQRSHLACAARLELAQVAPLFDPAKHLLDATADMDRLGVALVAVAAAIDGGRTRVAGVPRRLECHSKPPKLSDHGLGLEVHVEPKGIPVGKRDMSRNGMGSIPALRYPPLG